MQYHLQSLVHVVYFRSIWKSHKFFERRRNFISFWSIFFPPPEVLSNQPNLVSVYIRKCIYSSADGFGLIHQRQY